VSGVFLGQSFPDLKLFGIPFFFFFEKIFSENLMISSSFKRFNGFSGRECLQSIEIQDSNSLLSLSFVNRTHSKAFYLSCQCEIQTLDFSNMVNCYTAMLLGHNQQLTN